MIRRHSPIFHGWFIVGVLFVVSIIESGFTYIFAVFLKPLSEEFGWSRGATSGAFALYSLTAGLVLPWWGWVADRKGVRLVFIVCAIVDGAALMTLSIVRSLTMYYALYVVLGLGLGGIGPTTVGKIISQWFVAKRGRAMGIALVGAGGGGLVLVPLAGVVIDAFDWRIAYIVLGALSLGVVLPLSWLFLVDTPQEKGLLPLGHEPAAAEILAAPGRSAERRPDLTLSEALRTPIFWLLAMTFSLAFLASFAIVAHQVALLQDAGFTLTNASTVAGLTLGMSMAGRLVIGWSSDHTRNPHLLLSLAIFAQAAGVAFLLYSSVGPSSVAMFPLLFGLGYGGLVVLWPLVISHDFGLRSFGAIAGVMATLALGLGGAIGPVMAGVIFDRTGSYVWVLVTCIVAQVVAACAAWLATTPRMPGPLPAPAL